MSIDEGLYDHNGNSLEEVELHRPPTCFRCRRLRDDVICYGCPKAGLRNILMGIEESAVITAIAATITIPTVILVLKAKGLI